MVNLNTQRLLPIALAGLLLPLPACVSPFARTPKPPHEYAGVERVHYDFTPETQHEFRLEGLERVEQLYDTSCWAACAEMVSNWRSGGTTQEEFLERTRALSDGSEESVQAATRHEILLALAPDRRADLDRLWEELILRAAMAVAAQAAAQTDEEREYYQAVQLDPAMRAVAVGLSQLDDTVDLDTALAELQDGEPVVVGLTEIGANGQPYGHACVLIGLRAIYSGPRDALAGVADMAQSLTGTATPAAGFVADSGYIFLEATLIDPAKGKQDVRTMPATELVAKATFFASRTFAEKFIEQEVQTLTTQY
jgi:hypothetical protein